MVDQLDKRPTITKAEVARRMNAGLTWRQIIETPLERVSTALTYEYQGQAYTLKQLSELSGLSVAILRGRICRAEWSVERAVRTRRMPNDGRRNRDRGTPRSVE